MILVDGDILIASLRGMPAARGWLLAPRRDSGPLAVSAVSMTEVAGRMRSPERQVSRLLASMRVFPVTERIAWRAAEFRRACWRSHQGIGPGNYLIAAPVEGLDLATLSVRHFPMIGNLRARSGHDRAPGQRTCPPSAGLRQRDRPDLRRTR